MQFNSWLIDRRIRAINVSVELTVSEYWTLAQVILKTNEMQRTRVASRGKVYQLLRRDLLDGCVMPPIILAVSETKSSIVRPEIDRAIADNSITAEAREVMLDLIGQAINEKEMMILDGLQRTYTIQECISEAIEKGNINQFGELRIRAEIYLGLSKMGILYRMLTLNSGQTPMSFRHQIEILYQDYIDNDALPDGMIIVREVERKRARGVGRYRYSDVVDMFYAYATGSPQPFDKQALITQLREIDFLEDYNSDADDLMNLVSTYNQFITKVQSLSGEWRVDRHDEDEDDGDFDEAGVRRPFGRSVSAIFARSQPMSGFGAECKRLLSLKKAKNISEISGAIEQFSFGDGEPAEALNQLIIILGEVASKAKKVGDAQRSYFQLCFRHLLNNDSDAYQDLSRCWIAGQETYRSLY